VDWKILINIQTSNEHLRSITQGRTFLSKPDFAFRGSAGEIGDGVCCEVTASASASMALCAAAAEARSLPSRAFRDRYKQMNNEWWKQILV
jgi:hypothetical protein